MTISKKRAGKRLIAVLSSAAVAVSLLAGCGSAKDKTEQPTQSAQPSQPGQANPTPAADDVLAQFPPAKMPFEVAPTAVITEYQGGKLTGQEFVSFLRFLGFTNPQQGMMIGQSTNEMIKDYARQYTASKILSARADQTTQAESKKLAETIYGKIKGQYMSMLGNDEAKFNKLLAGHQLTKEDIVNHLFLINNSVAVLKKGVKDEELKKTYDKMDKTEFTTASVRHILIDTKNRKPEEALKKAKDLVARLKKGEDFAKLAKENTDDPGSKESGGLYADANVNDWVAEFKQAALVQKIGEISDPPVKTQFGYHIIRVENRKVKTFDEVKETLSQSAINDAYENFLKNEADKLVTKWNLPQVKAPATTK